MAERERRQPHYSRRLFWLGAFVLVLFGGYSIGWLYLGDLIERETRSAMAAVSRDGVTAECANPTARGFPFRIGLFCDRVAFADASQGLALAAGRFRSAGQIYDPLRLVAELDGPASIELPEMEVLAIDWTALRASARLAKPMPSRVSVEGAGISAGFAGGPKLATVSAFEAHLRPNGADLDLAGSFDDLAVDPALVDGRRLPPLSGRSDIVLKDGVALIEGERKELRGRSATIRMLSLSSDGKTGVTVSGAVAIDSAGLVDADLNVTIRDPGALSAILAEAFPEAGDKIAGGLSGLAALGAEPSLPLRIAKGKVSLGFIPLGAIRPLP